MDTHVCTHTFALVYPHTMNKHTHTSAHKDNYHMFFLICSA